MLPSLPLTHRRLPGFKLFPYTTLFRSRCAETRAAEAMVRRPRQPEPGQRLEREQRGIHGERGARQAAELALDLRGQPGEIERRSEEHTSELQSQFQLVCRLRLGKRNRR